MRHISYLGQWHILFDINIRKEVTDLPDELPKEAKQNV